MKKYVVVEVPKNTTTVDVSVCNRINQWSIKKPPILHGKRALLEECLKTGEFDTEYRKPRRGETYLCGNYDKLSAMEALFSFMADEAIVLTDLDEPEPEKDEWERTKERLNKMVPSDVVGLRTILQQLCDELDRRCPKKGKP